MWKGSVYVVNIPVRVFVYYIRVLVLYYMRVLVCQYVRVGKGSIYVVNIRFFISKYTRALALTFVNSNLNLVQGAEKSVRETLLCSKYSIYVVSILGQ